MKRSDRAKEVNKILNRIYKKVPIPLKHNNKFELLIAVLLSAQCTDERVNQVTPIPFKLANTAKELSKISVGTIYKIIKPCGLGPQKSRAISKLSKILNKKAKSDSTKKSKSGSLKNIIQNKSRVNEKPSQQQSTRPNKSQINEKPSQQQNIKQKVIFLTKHISLPFFTNIKESWNN